MEKSVGVITNNDYFYQKIYLCLGESCQVYRADATGGMGAVIFDCDSMLSAAPEGCITAGRDEGCMLRTPFSDEELIAAVSETRAAPVLGIGDRCAYLRGRKIKLTELELSLLCRLMSAKGEFVSREQLLSDVWHGEAERGIVNVYIHYLREKLEADGEKIILSSRQFGYCISKRYLSEEEIC